jgi:hypothetical protein
VAPADGRAPEPFMIASATLSMLTDVVANDRCW